MKNAGYQDAEFRNREALDAEVTRVFEKCHDCRRCLPLCPSFPSLFESIDKHELQAAQVTEAERRHVVDECFECKLCYNNCPYHPPHEWAIDFPRLMNRAKIVQADEEGIPFADRIGQRQDLLGKMSCLMPGVTNRVYRNGLVRTVMEKGTGIDRRWQMPTYARRFSAQHANQVGEDRAEHVVLYPTCFVEYSDAATGHATAAVLEHNNVGVDVVYKRCCGAPYLHGGDLEGARRSAAALVDDLAPHVRAGKSVVVPGPTCSYQIKKEFPELLDSDDARVVAENTFDPFEFLWTLRGKGTLARDWGVALGRVGYHLPCHLKSQNIGFRSMQFLKGAGADVEMFDHCSGVDGTWGMKVRNYDQSLEVARPLLDAVAGTEFDHVASDCPLAALRIREGTGQTAVHPIVLLSRAYGLGVTP